MARKITILKLTSARGGAEGVLDVIYEYYSYSRGNIVSKVVLVDSFKPWDIIQAPFRIMKVLNSSDLIISSSIWSSALLGLVINFNFKKIKPTIVARESTDIVKRYTGLSQLKFKSLYRLYKKDFKVVTQTLEMQNNLSSVGINSVVIKNPYKIKQIIGSEELIYKLNKESYILGVGRLIPVKGFDLLIRAFYQQDSVKVLKIIGDGPELPRLKSLIDTNSASHRVDFLGYLKNPYPYMVAARICAISSRMEGFPNTLLEMIQFNGSVISTKCVQGLEDIPVIDTCEVNAMELSKRLVCAYNRPPVIENLRKEYLTKNHSIENFMKYLNNYVQE